MTILEMKGFVARLNQSSTMLLQITHAKYGTSRDQLYLAGFEHLMFVLENKKMILLHVT